MKADPALLVVSFIWGTTFVVMKNALQDTSTLLFLTLRFTVAGLALLPAVSVDRTECQESRSQVGLER